MSAVDLQREPAAGEVSTSNSGFTTRMPSGSDLQSPESPSVRGRRDLPTSSSSSEEELDRGASTYRRSSRGWEIPHLPPSSVIPPPPMFNTRSYGRGREDWAAAYYGGLGGPMPINAYPGYPLAFDNIKMGESEIEKLAGLLKEHDKMKVENCNGDIDALLILTGLFSAIVAAFTIESYKNLQPDPTLASATLLAQLVLHFNGTDGLQNTGFSFSPLPSGTASIDVLVNSFWFVSLICSVITASVGIFVKQWLRDYLNINCSSSEEWVRVRQVRNESAHRWKVFELSDFLPLLLQLALLLFLIGLALFLMSINVVVGWIVTAGVIFYVSGLTFIVVVPMISASCPYQIAFLRRAAEYVRGSFIRIIYGVNWRQRLGYENPFYRFPGDERGVRREQKLDVEAVIGADTSLMDNTALEETLRPCLSSFGLKSTILFAREVLANRLDRSVSHLTEIKPDDYISIPRQVLDVLLRVFCDCVDGLFDNTGEPLSIPNMERYQSMVEALWGFYTLLDHLHKTDRRRHMSNWDRATRGMDSARLPGLCLEPFVEGSVPESVKFEIVNFGSREFVKMMVECPNAKIEDNIPLTADAIKNLLHAATTIVSTPGETLTAVSVARVVFHTLASNNISSVALEESIPSILSTFCSAFHARKLKHQHHDEDSLLEEAKLALDAANTLTSRLPGTTSAVDSELVASLRTLSLPDRHGH